MSLRSRQLMINKVYLYLMLRNWISAFVLVLITGLSSLSFAQDEHASKTTPLSPAQIKMKDSLYVLKLITCMRLRILR